MEMLKRKTTIVPGRRMITEAVAMYEAGIIEDYSYLAEKTLMSVDSTRNMTEDDEDDEERRWKKEGLSDRDIFLRIEERTHRKHAEAAAQLQAKLYGAKTFEELLARPEYAVHPTESDEESDEEEGEEKEEHLFAIPSLPKHLSEKSIMGSPNVGTRGSGKAGLSCSTPVGGKDVSMRSLRGLDISHVMNATTQMDAIRMTMQQKTAALQFEQSTETLQGTYTIGKDGEAESLQKTFTVDGQESEASLQRTFVKEREEPLQSTFTHPANTSKASEASASLQGTFVKSVIEEPPLAENSLQGGEKRNKKKVDLSEREGRMADLTSSLLSSMISNTPSPGAHHFKNPRKKLRETVQTPPRIKALDNNRMSIESDKERSIQMLSIAESSGRESVGSSYVDPISVNASRVSPIREEESHPMEIATTPKSARRNDVSIRQMKSIEQIRDCPPVNRISSVAVDPDEILTTPTVGYQKQTFSSLVKHKNSEESRQLLEEMSKKRSPSRTPAVPVVKTPLRQLETKSSEKLNLSQRMEEYEEKDEVRPEVVEKQQEGTSEEVGNKSISIDINALSIDDVVPQPDDFDRGDYHDYEEEMSDGKEEEEAPKKSSRRRIGLLSDSIATVNTPGIDRRPTRPNETVADNWDSDEEVEGLRKNRKKAEKQVGLQLAKRRIIEPEEAQDGVRRSSRVRVKPVRSWLGEQPVYVHSPSGGRRLKGVTDVIIKDKRLCKYRTADLKLATEREQREKAKKREKAAEKRRRLALDHSRGHRLNESQEDIVTSDED